MVPFFLLRFPSSPSQKKMQENVKRVDTMQNVFPQLRIVVSVALACFAAHCVSGSATGWVVVVFAGLFSLGLSWLSEESVSTPTAQQFKWKGKRVAVTGGAGGLGREIIAKLLQYECTIASWDNNTEALSSLKKDYPSVRTATVDVTCKDTIQTAANEFGKIDVLICNAGIVAGANCLDVDSTTFKRTIEVNTIGVINCVAVLESDLEASGRLCVVSSAVAGVGSVAGLGEYCASKWALTARVEEWKRDKPFPITTVSPSFMTTPLFEGVQFNLAQRILTPPLHPAFVAEALISGVANGDSLVFLPRVFYLVRLAALVLPASLIDTMATLFGVHHAADNMVRK